MYNKYNKYNKYNRYNLLEKRINNSTQVCDTEHDELCNIKVNIIFAAVLMIITICGIHVCNMLEIKRPTCDRVM